MDDHKVTLLLDDFIVSYFEYLLHFKIQTMEVFEVCIGPLYLLPLYDHLFTL